MALKMTSLNRAMPWPLTHTHTLPQIHSYYAVRVCVCVILTSELKEEPEMQEAGKKH